MTKIWEYISTTGLWVFYVFLIVFVIMITNYILKKVFDIISAKLEKTKNPWDDALISAARRPAKVLVWVVGLTVAANVIDHMKLEQANLSIYIDHLRTSVIIFVVAWFMLRLAKKVELNLKTIKENEKKEFDHTTLEAVSKLFRISIVITAVLVAMEYYNIPITGVMTFGGIGGIAVGFAARDLLANFFGAMMIYLDRPFAVGDWVRSPDRNIEGTVEAIGWRLTRIRTFDKRPLYVPNSIFTSIAVENPSRMLNRRIKETVGIRYSDATKMRNIVKKVKAMLQQHDDIDTRQTMIVNFNKFAASSLDFFIYTFTKTTNWVEYHEIKQDVMLKVIDIIEAEGAECAFPTSTVHMPDPLVINSTESTFSGTANKSKKNNSKSEKQSTKTVGIKGE